MTQQLTLDLGFRPAFGREDFLVTDSNAAAVALVDLWPNWPSHVACLVGPAASGKSHLASVWRQKSGALEICAGDVRTADVPQLTESGRLVLEEFGQGAFDETAVFHLLNQVRALQGSILIIARQWPPLAIGLPDLASRLNAVPVVRMAQPDDALLRGVLLKQFNDRQLSVDEALLSYLVARMPRSLGFASQLVSVLDTEALAEGVAINRSFAAKILARLEQAELL